VATHTFLCTDIGGSASMSQRLGDAYWAAVADHLRLIRMGLAAHGGEEIASQGGALFAVFTSPRACADAAIQIQRTLASHTWPGGERVGIQMGIHSSRASGTAAAPDSPELRRASRIASVAHGGQVVLSATAAGLLRESPPNGASLKDLGSHRLNESGQLDQLFELQAEGLREAFPPLPSLDDLRLLSNLPAQVSTFIGREAELTEVRDLLAVSRLVTLTGAGGAGKTRLALQVAVTLADGAADGMWFADLAPLRDPDLVAATVADVLGVRQEPGRPLLDTLAGAVGGRSLLVLLDNCEHVIGACAKLADALLRGCPGLAMLATSREPLGIDGERVYRVPSMATPADGDDAAAIRASEAVRLLEDRAASQGAQLAWDEPAAAVVGRICRRLDGIPLALELAAARLRVMPLAELEARLDERFVLLTGGSRAALPRQQTLRAMVDWSWELLTAAERTVLARLSVFAGGFGLAAGEAVAAGPDVPAPEVLGYLGALVDKSLVQFGDPGTGPARYRLLETVRQYAAGQLDTLGPAAAVGARTAHRDYYLALAEAAAPQLAAADQAAWLDRLDAELGNLRAAIAFSLDQRDPAPGLRLAASLRVYWAARGHAAEGAEALRALADAPTVQDGTLPRARALGAAAHLLGQAGSYSIAWNYCRDALAIARAIGDEHLVADLLQEQAWLLASQGQVDAAMLLAEQGLALARGLGEPHLTGRLLTTRAHAANVAGDHAGAARDTAESVRLFRQADDRLQAGQALGNLGYYELTASDLDAARIHLAEALDIARTLNARDGIVYTTFNLGLADYLAGSPDAAEALFAESLALARRMGMKRQAAYALIGLALAARGTGPDWPARLHGAADQAFADLGEAVEPLEGRLADLDRQRLRAEMGDEAFEAEYAVGGSLDSTHVLAALARRAGASGGARTAASSPGAGAMLTPRELDVLTLVAQGLSNPDIARRLVLSQHTVHRHLANILRKLDLSSRAAAAAWAVRSGLI
jgi:predicted ATPase/DNA-binding CsgD family transcriptional regulator